MTLNEKLLAIAALLSVTLLSGCSDTLDDNGTNERIHTEAVSFPDGSAVNCAFISRPNGSAVECNWNENVTVPEKSSLLGSVEKVGSASVRCVTVNSFTEYKGGIDCEFS